MACSRETDGYQNLLKLVSDATFAALIPGRAGISKPSRNTRGLIAFTGCLAALVRNAAPRR